MMITTRTTTTTTTTNNIDHLIETPSNFSILLQFKATYQKIILQTFRSFITRCWISEHTFFQQQKNSSFFVLNLRETREHEALSTRRRRRSLDVKQEENTINGALTLYYERKKKKGEGKGREEGEEEKRGCIHIHTAMLCLFVKEEEGESLEC